MKQTKPKRTSATKQGRDITPQPAILKQESNTRLNQSMNLTPLRSNIKKPSAVKSSKKVVIQDPAFQFRVKEMLYNIQQFFIKKILKYQQEGFDAIHEPYRLDIEREDRIAQNHALMVQRIAFSEWTKMYIQSQKAKHSSALQKQQASQKRLYQKKLTPFEQDEVNLWSRVSQYSNQRIIQAIFGTWKKDFNDARYNSTQAIYIIVVSVKNTTIKDNLNKFLSDMVAEVRETKPSPKVDKELRQAIAQHKTYLPQRSVKKVRRKVTSVVVSTPSKKPQSTQSAQKSSVSFSKDSQTNLFQRNTPTDRVSRILFQDALSPNSTSQRSIERNQIKKNLSAQKFHHVAETPAHQRCPSQPSMLKNVIHNKTVSDQQYSSNQPMEKASSRVESRASPKRQPQIEPLVVALQNLVNSRVVGCFDAHHEEQKLVEQRMENLKRKVIFNWMQMIPELKVERFQLRFRGQRLMKVFVHNKVKALRLPFFKALKQVNLRPDSNKAIDKISQFLDCSIKKKKK